MGNLWLLCGIAIAVVALIAMVGGSTTRSLDDVYARRDGRARDAQPTGTPDRGPAVTPDAVVAPDAVVTPDASDTAGAPTRFTPA